MNEICKIFTQYIVGPTVQTTEKIEQGLLKEDGVTPIKQKAPEKVEPPKEEEHE